MAKCSTCVAAIERFGIMMGRRRFRYCRNRQVSSVPSWELTYPLLKVLLSRWFSFSQGGVCDRSLEGTIFILHIDPSLQSPPVPEALTDDANCQPLFVFWLQSCELSEDALRLFEKMWCYWWWYTKNYRANIYDQKTERWEIHAALINVWNTVITQSYRFRLLGFLIG